MAVNVEKIKTDARYISFDSVDLGSTVGPIEFIKEDTKKEIKADQRGPNPIAELITGMSLRVKCELQECDVALLQKLWNDITTESVTPGAGTECIGFGTSKIGTNLATVAKPLTLKGINATDESDTIHFWKAYPITEGLKLSGEETRTMAVEFVVVEDTTKDKKVSYGVYGDYTQDFTTI